MSLRYIYGKETSPNERLYPVSDVERELEAKDKRIKQLEDALENSLEQLSAVDEYFGFDNPHEEKTTATLFKCKLILDMRDNV
jgi:hypothetical protein